MPTTKPQRGRHARHCRAGAGKLLDGGVYTSVTGIAEAEGIGKSYVSRILRPALLAPDIAEASGEQIRR